MLLSRVQHIGLHWGSAGDADNFVAGREFIGRVLADLMKPKVRKVWGLEGGDQVSLIPAASLWLCTFSPVCFSAMSPLPSLSFLYHMPSKLWLFQPHSLRPLGKRPV